MVKRLLSILLVVLTVALGSLAQEIQGWTRSGTLDLESPSALRLAHNGVEIVRHEVLDTNTVRLLGRTLRLSEAQYHVLVLTALSREENSQLPNGLANVYQIGPDDKSFEALFERLRDYARARASGHTRECLMAALTNNVQVLPRSSSEVRALVSKMPLVPASWLRQGTSYNVTNMPGHMASWAFPGEVCHWVSFTLTDGDIGWKYELCFKANGQLAYAGESKCDAKEFDTKYKKLIEDAEAETTACMKKDGTLGLLGSCHQFWQLKREILKAKGVDWKSPSELNPGTIFD